jgi:hypothetical protein
MNDQVRLNHFFSVLREKRKAFADNYAYFAPKLAPRFNSFNFIRPDELKLSKILAMLLNPNGDHAQGDLFLQLFFTEIEITYPNYTTNIKVGCEVSTDRIENTARRIDIEVDFDRHFGLAIENKPWTYDQDKQLSDYAKQMGKKFENWCLIYLSGTDSDPHERSATAKQLKTLEENDQYKKINFSHIVKWLKNCEAQCQADHVRHFLRDFISYCENEFLGGTNMVDANLIKDFALKDKENLELALIVGQQIITIKKDLLEKFITDLETEFKTALPDWEFDRDKNFSYEQRWKDIRFRKPDWKNYFLAIAFDMTECRGLYCGISKKEEKIPDFSAEIIKTLNDGLKKASLKTPWFP